MYNHQIHDKMKTIIKIITVAITLAIALLLIMAESADGNILTTLAIKISGISFMALTAMLWKLFRLSNNHKLDKFLEED